MPDGVPQGLGPAGLLLWEDVQREFELLPDEERLLEAACRTSDELATLEAALAQAEPVVAGSTGQDRVHPLFAEVRAHRLALKQLLTGVGIEEAEADRHAGAARSQAGRSLARKRWERRGAA